MRSEQVESVDEGCVLCRFNGSWIRSADLRRQLPLRGRDAGRACLPDAPPARKVADRLHGEVPDGLPAFRLRLFALLDGDAVFVQAGASWSN